MVVNGNKLGKIKSLMDHGKLIRDLIKAGYTKDDIKKTCAHYNNSNSVISREIDKGNSKTMSLLLSVFNTSTVKNAIKTKDTTTCVRLLGAGANISQLKSLKFSESTIVSACNKYKSNSSTADKLKFIIKLNGNKDSKTLKAQCKKKIKGYSDSAWSKALKSVQSAKKKNTSGSTKVTNTKATTTTTTTPAKETTIKRSEGYINANEQISMSKLNKAVAAYYHGDKNGNVSSKYFEKEETNLNHLIGANMMRYKDYKKWDVKFNRMQFANPYIGVSNVREYLFFTKPDLGILNPVTKGLRPELRYSSFWREMYNRYRRIISDLQVSARRSDSKYKLQYRQHDRHVFIPLLTNAVNSQLDLPSVSADTSETSQTIYGTSMQYRKSSVKSDEGYDFSLDFIDAPWLDVYHFFKMWDEYESLKDMGYIGPPELSEKSGKPTTTGYYRINKILHDQIAIYKFVVDGDDMETILFYAKLIGCFPKSVPRDSWSSFKGDGNISYSIDWHAQFVEDMNPNILYEFNELCYSYFGGKTPKLANKKYYSPYSTGYGEPNGGFRQHPFIEKAKSHQPNSEKYLLRWYG